MRTPPRR